jgi:hypothetical protein
MELLAAMEGMEGMEGMEVMEGAGRSRSVRVPFYVTKSAHQVLITRAQLLSLHTFCRSCDRSIEHYRPMRADIAWEELRLERESLSAPAHALHVSVRELSTF